MEERGANAYIAELLGTYLLVLFIATILAVQTGSAGGVLSYRDFAVVGLVHVFVLAMLIASLGGVSGAHFNPAVTTALAAVRKITVPDAAIYVLMQLAGAVLAALTVKLILHDPGATVHEGATLASPAIKAKAFTAMLVELIGTFVLMWSIMAAAVNPRASRHNAPWIIGATLGLAVMAFGPLTGAGFNPARAFGPSLVGGGEDVGRFLLIYVVGPLIGALLAAFAYRALVLIPEERLPGERPIDKLD